jgi:hypothetical protein
LSAARPVRIELVPSYRLAAALCCAHAVAAASVLLVLPTGIGLLLAVAFAALGVAAAWSRALLRARGSVHAIELADERIMLHLRDGRTQRVEISARRYVSRWLVTLPLRSPMRRTLLITADMVRGDLFRVLRIWATWGRTPAMAPGPARV